MITKIHPDTYRVLQSVATDGFSLKEIPECNNNKNIMEVIEEAASLLPDAVTAAEQMRDVLAKKKISLNETVNDLIKDGRIFRLYISDEIFPLIFSSVYGRLFARLEINKMSLIDLKKMSDEIIKDFEDSSSFYFSEFLDFEKYCEFKLLSTHRKSKEENITKSVLDIVEVTKDFLDKYNLAYTYEALTEIAQTVWKSYDYQSDLSIFAKRFLIERKEYIKKFLSQ